MLALQFAELVQISTLRILLIKHSGVPGIGPRKVAVPDCGVWLA